VKRLNGVHQRRTVPFPKDVFANFDFEIGTDADEVVIESRMVEGTERKAVVDVWLASRLRVANDVSRVEEFVVAKTAEGALTLVCIEDSFPKSSLMETHADCCSHVSSAGRIRVLVHS
jgi:hypothetical protein